MPHLFNPTSLTLHGHYAGVQYVFPPNARVTIKSRRAAEEIQVAEDIASKLYADLSPVGLILLDDETPLPLDEAKRISRQNLIAFIEQLKDDFNNLNAEQASANNKILQVPKHYKELYAMLLELRAEEGEDAQGEDGFLSKEQLEAIRQRGEVSRDQALRNILAAVETGDPEAVMAAAKIARAKAETGAATLEGQAKEDGFVTRSAPGRGGSQRGSKPTGRRRGRPGKAAAAGGDGGE